MASTEGDAAVTGNFRATVSVKLIKGDGENEAEVYGRITGRFGIDNEFELFDKKKHQYIPVRPGGLIPLSGPQVNVPSNATNLEITAHLMDYDMASLDDEIANGKATFVVKAAGASDTIPINGKYGSVDVNVVWG